MHILLTVLAVIGKILLVILALILLLLIILFCVSLTYKVGVVHETGTGPKDIKMRFRAGWLFGLLKVVGEWDHGNTFMKVKLCGFTLKKFGEEPKPEAPEEGDAPDFMDEPEDTPKLPDTETEKEPQTKAQPAAQGESEEKTKDDAQAGPKPKTETKNKADEVRPSSVTDKPKRSDKPAQTEKTSRSDKPAQTKKTSRSDKPKKTEKPKKAEQSKQAEKPKREKRSLRSRLRSKINTLCQTVTDLLQMFGDAVSQAVGAVVDFLTGLPDLLWKLPDSVDNIETKFDDLKKKLAPWLADCSVETYKKLLKELKYLLKHYLPRKVEGHLTFGTGDPALTAYVGGVIYQILPAGSSKFDLEPEFYERYLDADVTIKGHIRLCHVLKSAVVLLLNKNVRKTIRTLRRARGGK